MRDDEIICGMVCRVGGLIEEGGVLFFREPTQNDKYNFYLIKFCE